MSEPKYKAPDKNATAIQLQALQLSAVIAIANELADLNETAAGIALSLQEISTLRLQTSHGEDIADILRERRG